MTPTLKPKPPKSHRRRQLLGWALDLSLVLALFAIIALIMWSHPQG